jgi:hypothetical protein
MINEGPNIKDIPITQYQVVLDDLIKQKPIYRIEETKIKMNEIGG